MGLAVMDAAARAAVLPSAANMAQLCSGARGSSAACVPVLCSCCLAKHNLWPMPLLLVGAWLFLADLDSIHFPGSRGMSGAGNSQEALMLGFGSHKGLWQRSQDDKRWIRQPMRVWHLCGAVGAATAQFIVVRPRGDNAACFELSALLSALLCSRVLRAACKDVWSCGPVPARAME